MAQASAFEHAVFRVHFDDDDDDDHNDDVGRRRTSALSRVYADVGQRIREISEVNLLIGRFEGDPGRFHQADKLMCPLFI